MYNCSNKLEMKWKFNWSVKIRVASEIVSKKIQIPHVIQQSLVEGGGVWLMNPHREIDSCIQSESLLSSSTQWQRTSIIYHLYFQWNVKKGGFDTR